MTLEARDLAFGYGRSRIGSASLIELHQGEVVCLLGPNGGGKTTLMRTLLGLLPPLAGEIRLAGRDIAHWSRAALARQIAYVPQALTATFPFTVEEVVLMGRAAHIGLFRVPTATDRAIAGAAMERLGITRLGQRIYSDCSGGERQLALIARALAQEPRALVMDEPTASLDFGNQLRVLDVVREFARAGLAVLLSTHDPGHVFACGDRAVLLGGGDLFAAGRLADVVTPANLQRLYGVEVDIVTLPGDARPVCVPRRQGPPPPRHI